MDFLSPARRSYIIIVFFFLFLAFYCQCSFGCLIGTNPNIFAASTEPNSYRGGSSTMSSGILSFWLFFLHLYVLHVLIDNHYSCTIILTIKGYKLNKICDTLTSRNLVTDRCHNAKEEQHLTRPI